MPPTNARGLPFRHAQQRAFANALPSILLKTEGADNLRRRHGGRTVIGVPLDTFSRGGVDTGTP